MSQTIAILLATHNGEPYLAQQIDSLLAQDDADLHILVRDDGSSDATPGLIADYAERWPERLEPLPPDGRRLGARGSFDALLAHALAHPRGFQRFMFCDQDDVWLPDKVRSLRQALEAGVDDEPRLAHGDMRVVDQNLNPIAPSFWRRQRVDPGNTQLGRMLLQNSVTGHSALFNRALAELASPIPADAFMHDWWLALTAAAFGTIAAVDRPLTLYRQHTGNVLGSRHRTAARFLSWTHWRRKILRPGRHAAILRQAEAWIARYGDRLDEPTRRRLAPIMGITRAGWPARRWRLLRSGANPGNAVDYVDYLLKS